MVTTTCEETRLSSFLGSRHGQAIPRSRGYPTGNGRFGGIPGTFSWIILPHTLNLCQVLPPAWHALCPEGRKEIMALLPFWGLLLFPSRRERRIAVQPLFPGRTAKEYINGYRRLWFATARRTWSFEKLEHTTGLCAPHFEVRGIQSRPRSVSRIRASFSSRPWVRLMNRAF